MNPYAVDLYAEADKAPGVTSVHIPASVEAIDPGFFQLFPNAARIGVAAGDSPFISYNGMLFGANDAGEPTDLLLVPEGLEGVAVLPGSLAIVPACIFSRCNILSGLIIPTGSTGSKAFTTQDGILYNADKTILVAAPAGLGASAKLAPETTAIAEGAFWGNEALRTIVVPGKVDTVGAQFAAPAKGEDADDKGTNEGGASPVIPSEAEGSSPQANANTPAFSPEATQDATVQTDSREAWEAAGFTHFSQPPLPGAMAGPAWGQSGLSYKLLDDFTLAVRWEGTDAATEVSIPAEAQIDGASYKVSTIEEAAFEGQASLSKVTIPEGITAIGARAFAGCTALAAVDIPGSVPAIGDAAFEGCSSLAGITLYEGLRTIGRAAFKGTALQAVFIPATVETVGAEALADIADLARVVLLGRNTEADATALQGVYAADIYEPYREDGAYAFALGAPAAGNHLRPYGLKMAQTQLALTVGDSADLFAEGGYLHASGTAQVSYAYRAASVSVDAAGMVTAKQPGQTTITATITLDGRQLAKATSTATIKHAPQPEAPATQAPEEAIPEESDQSAEEPDPNEGVIMRPDTIQIDAVLDASNVQSEMPSVPRPEMVEGEAALFDPENKKSSDETMSVDNGGLSAGLPEEGATTEASSSEVQEADSLSPDVVPGEASVDDGDAHHEGAEAIVVGEAFGQFSAHAGIGARMANSISEAFASTATAFYSEEAASYAADARATTWSSLTVDPGPHAHLAVKVYGWHGYETPTGDMVGQDPYGYPIHLGITAKARQFSDGRYGWVRCKGPGDTTPYSTLTTYFKANGSQFGTPPVTTADDGRYMWQFEIRPDTGYEVSRWEGGFFDWQSENWSWKLSGGTYTAVCTPTLYSIAFDPAGGTYPGLAAGQNAVTSYNIESNGLYLVGAAPEKKGYRFVGYSYGGDGNLGAHLAANYHGTDTRYVGGSGWYGNLWATAIWEPISYAFTMHANGGTWSDGTTASKSVQFNIAGTIPTLPSNPTQSGYTFAGWLITGEFVRQTPFQINGITYVEGTPVVSGTNWSAISNPCGNATFIALWRSTVTLDMNTPPDGKSGVAGYIYYYPGYGWSKTGTTGQSIPSLAFATTSNGASLVGEQSVTGYTFKGFYSSKTSTSSTYLKLNKNGTLASDAPVYGATTWYAGYDAIQYTITLQTDGGNLGGKSTTIKYTKGQADVPFYTKKSDGADYNPTKYGSEFVGWKCTSYDPTITDGWCKSGNPYPDFYTGASQYGNYTLKAVWRIDITLDGNAPTRPNQTTVTQSYSKIYYYPGYGYRNSLAATGASWPTSGFLSESGGHVNAYATCTSNGGWRFNGYYTNKQSVNSGAYPNAISSDGDTCGLKPTAHATWYALWEGKVYTVKLDPGPSGANQPSPTQVAVQYGSYLPDCSVEGGSGGSGVREYPIPTFAGWEFDGYALGDTFYYSYCIDCPNGGNHLMSLRPWYVAGNATLTAKWTREIPIDLRGGSFSSSYQSHSITATYGQPLPASLASYGVGSPISPTNKPSGVTWNFCGYYSGDPWSGLFYDGQGKRVYNTAITSSFPSSLTAQWERSVPVDMNDGSGNTAFTLWCGMDYTIDDAPSADRTAYRFKGVATGPNGGTKTHDENGYYLSTNISPNAIPARLYIQWEAISYLVTWDFGDGEPASGVTYPTSYTIETGLAVTTAMNAIPANAYAFAGWKLSGDCNDNWNDGKVHPAHDTFISVGRYGNAVMTAAYTPIVYQVTWDFGNCEPASGVTYPTTYTVETGLTVTAAMNAVAPRGYTFKGWTLSGECNDNWNDGGVHPAHPNFISPGKWGNAKMSAVSSRNVYTVTYRCGICDGVIEDSCQHVADLNGIKTFTVTDLDMASDRLFVAPPTTFPYYRFDGWWKNSGSTLIDGDGSLYITDVGNVVCTMNVNEVYYDLSLEPGEGSWDADTANLGRFDVESDRRAWTRYCVEDAPFQMPVPKWAGHTFDHWERNGVRVSETFTPGTTQEGVDWGNITYTAVWSTNPYQITYELTDDRGPEYGAGSLPAGADNPHNYSWDSAAFELPIPSRVGYDFVGWTEEEVADDDPPSALAGQNPAPTITGSDPQIDVTVPTHSWGHRIYKAHWRAHEYDIAFDLDKGRWEDPQPAVPIEATYDQDVTLPKEPKRPRYLFSGWRIAYADALGNEVVEEHDAGAQLTRPNFISVVGTRADQAPDKRGTVTFEALWRPNLNVDVPIGSDGVHMGLSLKPGDGRDPFASTKDEWGKATIQNRSDGALKVVDVRPSASSDYDALQAEALQLFREPENLNRASFVVRPTKGDASKLQAGRFGIADATGGLTLVDDVVYTDPETYETGSCPRGWMMGPGSDATSRLDLWYQLDMGDLKPEDIDLLVQPASLHVADLTYTVALVIP